MIDLTKDKNSIEEKDAVDIAVKEITEISDVPDLELDKVNEIVKNVETMNFVEITQFKKNIDSEVSNLQGAKQLIDAISGVKDYDQTNRKIALENILTQAEYKGDAENFLKEYELNMARLQAIQEACAKRVEFYEAIDKNTTFLTSEMIDALDKRIALMSESEGNTETVSALKAVKHIFENRYNYDYVRNKSNIAHTIAAIKKDYKNKMAPTRKKMIRSFNKFFNASQMNVVEYYVEEQFNNDLVAAHIFLCHLGRLLVNAKGADYNWVKILIMNIIDIRSNIFDKVEEIDVLNKFLQELYPKYKF